MKICTYIDSITLGKLLKRYKSSSRGKKVIIKATQKRFSTWYGMNRLAGRLDFKNSNKYKNQYL